MEPEFYQLNDGDLRVKAKELSTVLAATTGELAVCLHVIESRKLWRMWEYESMAAYAEEELAINSGSIKTYLKAGKVAVSRMIPFAQVRSLGVGKLAALDSAEDDCNWDDVLTYATKHSVSELAEYLNTGNEQNIEHDHTVKKWSVKCSADTFEEIKRLTTMILLEQDLKLNGDGLLMALRHYWGEARSVKKAAA